MFKYFHSFDSNFLIFLRFYEQQQYACYCTTIILLIGTFDDLYL